MKQPKFRGYNFENKKWYYGHGWFEIDYTDEYLKEKGIEQQAMLYTDGYPVECELSSMSVFTGLKDKEGTDIYSGDIVAGNNRIQEDWRLNQEVRFLNGCFMFGNWNAHEYFNKHTEIKVMGNRYENPELI